jgi:hypothetical protein
MLLCNRPRPRTRPRPRSLIWNWFGSGNAAWRGVAYNAGGRQEAPLQSRGRGRARERGRFGCGYAALERCRLGNPAKQTYHDPLDRELHRGEKIHVGRIFRFKEWLPVIEKIAL